jgi:hypothetical protein
MKSICVTGMHRSGTSLAGGILERLGVDFGPAESMLEPGEENPRGFWEQAELDAFHRDLLAALGGTWDAPPVLGDGWERASALDPFRTRARQLVVDLFGEAPTIGWKDPKTSLVLPFWRTVLAVDKTVLVYRDPREVAQSLFLRDGFDHELGAYLWLRYVAAAWRDDPGRLTVSYDDFFLRLDDVLTTICRFADLPSPSAETRASIAGLADPSLRRSAPQGDDGRLMRQALALHRLIDESSPDVDAMVRRLHRRWRIEAAVRPVAEPAWDAVKRLLPVRVKRALVRVAGGRRS